MKQKRRLEQGEEGDNGAGKLCLWTVCQGKGQGQGYSVRVDGLFLVPEDLEKGGREGRRVRQGRGVEWSHLRWLTVEPEPLKRADIHTGGFHSLRIAWRGCLKCWFSGYTPPLAPFWPDRSELHPGIFLFSRLSESDVGVFRSHFEKQWTKEMIHKR